MKSDKGMSGEGFQVASSFKCDASNSLCAMLAEIFLHYENLSSGKSGVISKTFVYYSKTSVHVLGINQYFFP